MRAGHAVRATATASELEAFDGDDFDAGLAQRGVGAGVALVGDDDAGLEGNDVVAVVPLLALGFELVAAGRDDPHLADAEGLGHGLDQRARRTSSTTRSSAVSAGPDRPGAGPADDLGEQRDQVAVAHGDDGVEVHVAAGLRQVHGEHLGGRTGSEQLPGDEEHGLGGGALAHADHDRAVADRLHVATLDVALPQSSSAPPSQIGNSLGGEHRVEPVDGLHDHRLGLAGRLGHRVDGDAVEDPARRVTLEQEVGQRRQQHAVRVARLPHQTEVAARRRLLVMPPIRNSADLGGVGLGDPLARARPRHRCRPGAR